MHLLNVSLSGHFNFERILTNYLFLQSFSDGYWKTFRNQHWKTCWVASCRLLLWSFQFRHQSVPLTADILEPIQLSDRLNKTAAFHNEMILCSPLCILSLASFSDVLINFTVIYKPVWLICSRQCVCVCICAPLWTCSMQLCVCVMHLFGGSLIR